MSYDYHWWNTSIHIPHRFPEWINQPGKNNQQKLQADVKDRHIYIYVCKYVYIYIA
jgi:hypothetical protein